ATVERAGRSVTTLSARLLQGGQLCALALAAFATPRPSLTLAEGTLPAVAPPEMCPLFPPAGTPFAPPFTKRFEYRWALGDPPSSASASSRGGGWFRLAAPRRADAPLIAAFTDAWVPCLFPRLAQPIGAPTLDLTIHFRAPLPPPAAAPDDFYL